MVPFSCFLSLGEKAFLMTTSQTNEQHYIQTKNKLCSRVNNTNKIALMCETKKVPIKKPLKYFDIITH